LKESAFADDMEKAGALNEEQKEGEAAAAAAALYR
jgi:hypothetical protein